MKTILLAIFATLLIATLLSILFRRLNISHILAYIFTGTIVSYLFEFNTHKIDALELISEFGIVFLMFTIGLELSLTKIKKMKEILLINGVLQFLLSVVIFFLFSFYLFGLGLQTSLIIALAFSLSSTAIVLPFLKESKDIYTPYGKKSLGILIFQDISVIPILLLMTFLSYGDEVSMVEVLGKTLLAIVFIVLFIHFIGGKMMRLLLKFSASTNIEEIFLGAILTIVMGMSILTHEIGFTYSLGAFIAGVLIADTEYHIKVESDILSYKDLLLSLFFFSVGTKIDILYLMNHLQHVFLLFVGVMLTKITIIYAIIKRKDDTNTSIKTALALGQIGGFAFVVFEMASTHHLISQEIIDFLIVTTFLTMVATPLLLNYIYKISSLFQKEFYESDVITPIDRKNHIIIVGFGTLGRAVAKELREKGVDFIIICDNLHHVRLARRINLMAYFGHLNKKPVMESLKVEQSASVIITAQSEVTKILITKALYAYDSAIHIVLKVDSDEEREEIQENKSIEYIDSNHELSSRLVEMSVRHLPH